MGTTTTEDPLAEARSRLAEQSRAADVAGDWATYAAAVEAELQSWDTYLERLQASVVAEAWKAREQAEAGIGELRARRIAVDRHLAEEERDRVTAARRELAWKADELSNKLNGKERER